MVRLLALVTSLALAGPMAAFAQAADPGASAAEGQIYARDGFYVGASIAGVGYLKIGEIIARDVTDLTGDAANGKADTTVGVNGRVGYRMHPRVAAEVQFEWLFPSDVALTRKDRETGEFLSDDSAFEVKSWVVTANLKGYVLTAGNLQPFLVLGAGMMNGEVDGEVTKDDAGGTTRHRVSVDGFSFLGRMGGGVDYYFTPHIVGTVDLTYVLPVGDLSDFPYISGGLGLQYRF
jgi:opacity protein-like surface antigen